MRDPPPGSARIHDSVTHAAGDPLRPFLSPNCPLARNQHQGPASEAGVKKDRKEGPSSMFYVTMGFSKNWWYPSEVSLNFISKEGFPEKTNTRICRMHSSWSSPQASPAKPAFLALISSLDLQAIHKSRSRGPRPPEIPPPPPH